MEGPSLWEAIVQLLIEREQVHVVHGNVVCAVAAFQEARVDECCPVEPVQGAKAGQGGSKLALPQPLCESLSSTATDPSTHAALQLNANFTTGLPSCSSTHLMNVY